MERILPYRNRGTECNDSRFHPSTSIQTVVSQELKQVWYMDFIWLKWSSHNCAIPKEVCETLHVSWIEHVNFHIEFPPDMKAVHWNSFTQRNPSNIRVISWVVRISAIRD